MLYLSNACFIDILFRNNQPCSEGFFLQSYLKKKIEYLLETKVSNRLLLVLGVISPRAKSPFILFDISVFLLLTWVILSMFSGFKVSRGGFFVCFWGNFGIIFFFCNSFL